MEDPRIPVSYDPIRREYSLDGGETGYYVMNFCFWCGHKFPKNLSDEFCDIFNNVLKLDENTPDEELPEEFRTDEWWKKRGL